MLHPLASTPVTLYVVLEAGVTVSVFVLPEIGVHEYDARPAVAVNSIDDPAGIFPVDVVYDLDKVTVGSGLTVCSTVLLYEE